MQELDGLRRNKVAENLAAFLYNSAPEIKNGDIDPTIAMILDSSNFTPLYQSAQLIEVPDFTVKSPADGVDVDFRKSYANLLERPEGPKSGAGVGVGCFGNQEAVIFVANWEVRGAAVGEVEGELMVQGLNYARENDIPFICMNRSGGMDQAQGPMALLQMPRTATALELYKKHTKKPFLVFGVGPMLGGTTASVGLQGDVTAATAERLTIGFTGKRVVDFVATEIELNPSGIIKEVDQSAITNMLSGNGIDLIVRPNEMVRFITKFLDLTSPDIKKATEEETATSRLLHKVGSAITDFAAHHGTTRTITVRQGEHIISPLPYTYHNRPGKRWHNDEYTLPIPPKLAEKPEKTQKWRYDYESHISKRTLHHIDSIGVLQYGFDDYLLLRNPIEHSERLHFDNIIIALAKIAGQSVVVIGQQPDYEVLTTDHGKSKELVRRYAQPNPADWKKVVDAVMLAERYNIPLVSLLDSPGAASNKIAERNGQGKAMSDALAAISRADIPVLTYVIGAAGSGGAICQASLFPQPRALDSASIFVAATVATAGILRKPTIPSKPISSELLNTTADAMRLGADAWVGVSRVFRDIIPTKRDPRLTAIKLREAIIDDLKRFGGLTPEQLDKGKLAALVLTGANVRLVRSTSPVA